MKRCDSGFNVIDIQLPGKYNHGQAERSAFLFRTRRLPILPC
jgi:hypothetical protein